MINKFEKTTGTITIVTKPVSSESITQKIMSLLDDGTKVVVESDASGNIYVEKSALTLKEKTQIQEIINEE